MRNYYFEKGEKIKYGNGSFYLALHKTDMCPYALQRIQDPSKDYVTNNYSSFEHRNFLRYLTCWDQVEDVKVQKPAAKKLLNGKKKGMNLQSFLTRKKIQLTQNGGPKTGIGSKKQVNENPQQKQELRKVNVLYVQLQSFKKIEIPKDVNKIKKLMAIIYLLALEVHNELGFWPCMMPVYNNEKMLKFVKKGKSRNQQFSSLFQTMMAELEPAMWSQQMQSIYQMYEINADANLLAQKMIIDLQAIIHDEYEVGCTIQGVQCNQIVKILQPRMIYLEKSGYQLPLQQFIISFSFKDEKTRVITLQHQIFDDIILKCESTSFIAQYFKHIRTY